MSEARNHRGRTHVPPSVTLGLAVVLIGAAWLVARPGEGLAGAGAPDAAAAAHGAAGAAAVGSTVERGYTILWETAADPSDDADPATGADAEIPLGEPAGKPRNWDELPGEE